MVRQNSASESTQNNSHQKTIQHMTDMASAICAIQAEHAHPLNKESYPTYTETEKILYNMLTENTGAHILDSGGAYGRHWQQNRGIADFNSIPSVKTHKMYGARKHVFAIVNDIATYDKAVDCKFHKFAAAPENRDKLWVENMEEFAETYNEDDWLKDHGANTYGFESYCGNQEMQYDFLTIDGHTYIVLQFHGGCDIREGYTTPHVFECDYDDFIIASTQISISCMCNCAYSDGFDWTDDSGDDVEFSWDDGLHSCWNWKNDDTLFCSKCKRVAA